MTHEDISKVLKIAPKTLREHYREELDVGMAEANLQVLGKLYGLAMEGNVSAVIFWCKSRMKMYDTDPDAAAPVQLEFSQFGMDMMSEAITNALAGVGMKAIAAPNPPITIIDNNG